MRTGDLLIETLALRPRAPAKQLVDVWRTVSPRGLAALLAYEGASIWLLRRLRELGAAEAAPAPLVEALRKRATADQARAMLVDAETEELVRYLSARGIPHVLIKGNARRAAATLYPYADARATLDVDVLLPKQCVQAAWDGLREMGWAMLSGPGETRAGHYHLPALLGPHGIGVELHWSIGRIYSAEEAWQRANGEAVEIEWHQLRVRVPSATELLWHGLTHALRADLQGFRLRFLLDGASILASGAAVDWDRVVSRLARGEVADASVARAWLRTAARLAGCDLPASVPGASTDFDVVCTFAWRLAVLTRGRIAGFTGRLLEEGTRVELGLGVAPVVAGTGPFKQTRRWLAGRAARLVYRVWRVAARGTPTQRSG